MSFKYSTCQTTRGFDNQSRSQCAQCASGTRQSYGESVHIALYVLERHGTTIHPHSGIAPPSSAPQEKGDERERTCTVMGEKKGEPKPRVGNAKQNGPMSPARAGNGDNTAGAARQVDEWDLLPFHPRCAGGPKQSYGESVKMPFGHQAPCTDYANTCCYPAPPRFHKRKGDENRGGELVL